MIILGWIITIIGGITSVVSLANRSDAVSSYYGYGRYYNSGAIDDAELTLFIGIAIIFIGVIILITGYTKKRSNTTNTHRPNCFPINRCLNCGHIPKQDDVFCSNCGNNLRKQF